MRRLPVAAILTIALLGTACTAEDAADEDTSPTTTVDPAGLPRAELTAAGSVGQVHVSDADPGARIALHGADGERIESLRVDGEGTAIFRLVPPGSGYRVVVEGEDPTSSAGVTVLSEAGSTPDAGFYRGQRLEPGLGYITTRDGTTLSARVFLPGPPENGPYPTVVEYSGYNPSAPPSRKLRETLGLTDEACADGTALAVSCDTPAQPSSTLALAMEFAVVAVNVRGTGCSGGAYDFFEPLQVLDGYDVIETVAAQPWVLNNKVGMVGLSYPGISQLFVASARPPSLAAITPLSVFDDVARGLVAPGGIYNEGFAFEWAEKVLEEAEPLGQGWEQDVIDDGDTTCLANQRFRGWNVDAVSKAKENPFYDPEVADPLNPSLFVDRIDVPVFLTGSWQDEQTGPAFAHLLDRFTNAPVRRFTVFNGAHADGYAPQILVEWKAFLDLYVAGGFRPIPEFIRVGAPALLADTFGVTVPLPEERWLAYPDAAAARAAYEAEPELRVIWETGGETDRPGAPVGRFESTHATWPVPVAPTTWYLQADGTLTEAAPDNGDPTSSSGFTFNPDWARKRTFEGENASDLFKALPEYDWTAEPEGEAVVMLGEPLERDLPMLGTGSVDLHLQSTDPEAELEVTLSEVRADGQEVYVQSGWLRASRRALDPASTPLWPRHTFLADDVAMVPPGRWTPARVEIMPFGHVFREGSRIRLSVHSPGGNRPRWNFIVQEYAEPPFISISHSREFPSAVVLPVVDRWPAGVTIPREAPVCPGLRGQPCRPFQQQANQAGRPELDGGPDVRV